MSRINWTDAGASAFSMSLLAAAGVPQDIAEHCMKVVYTHEVGSPAQIQVTTRLLSFPADDGAPEFATHLFQAVAS